MATDEKWPPLDPGTSVKTTKSNTRQKEWMPEAWAARKWGVPGTIIGHHDSHGLCYDVKHDDGSEGCYDPSEFLLVEEQSNTFEKLLEAMEAYSDARAGYKKAKEGCQVEYYLHTESERVDRSKDALRCTLAAYVKEVMVEKNTF